MANPEHLAILKQGVEVWNKWHGAVNLADWRDLPDLSEADLVNRNLHGVDFSFTKLIDVNLSGANLSDAFLNTTDLRFANLTGANLTGADLCGANLNDADLGRAVLSHANLSGASLVRTNLSSANLFATNLSRTLLIETVLRETKLNCTVIVDTDLSKVRELDAAVHVFASSVGLDTLYQSQGKIPDKFLRDAGVPEDVIEHLLPLIRSGSPIQWHSCFISYSHEDTAFARLLHDRLQVRGVRCWLDEHQLLPGDDLHEGIDRGIRSWDKVLLCASKASLTSWWVGGEINRAFQKEAQIMKERSQNMKSTPHPSPLPARGGEGGRKVLALIPLNLDGFLFSADYQSGKKAEITSRVAANFVGWEKDHTLFDRELEKVIRALLTGEGGREKPPSAKL